MNPAVIPTVIVTFDLESRDYYNSQYFYNLFNEKVNSGYIGSYAVTSLGFAYRVIVGKCPSLLNPSLMRSSCGCGDVGYKMVKVIVSSEMSSPWCCFVAFSFSRNSTRV